MLKSKFKNIKNNLKTQKTKIKYNIIKLKNLVNII